MDSRYEDNMLSQIEQNLSNNISENLFLTGKVFENSKTLTKKKYLQEQEKTAHSNNNDAGEYPLVSTDYISNTPAAISRAEYIRQAREACLRQLSNNQLYVRPYELNYPDTDTGTVSTGQGKKTGRFKLLSYATNHAGDSDEENPREIAAFRSLIIRTVCAIIIFISLFTIDKFKFNIGDITYGMIREYITGKDSLKALEDVIVAWLK